MTQTIDRPASWPELQQQANEPPQHAGDLILIRRGERGRRIAAYFASEPPLPDEPLDVGIGFDGSRYTLREAAPLLRYSNVCIVCTTSDRGELLKACERYNVPDAEARIDAAEFDHYWNHFRR